MIKIILASLLWFSVTLIKADPSPFGLEINKATIKDLKSKYSVKPYKSNEYKNQSWYKYSININEIDINGLQKVEVTFDKSKRLVAVMTTFTKSKFQFLFDTMKQKNYKLLDKEIPFVGDKIAIFTNGKTTIHLNAPHLSFNMNLNYYDTSTLNKLLEVTQKKKQNKKVADQSKL